MCGEDRCAILDRYPHPHLHLQPPYDRNVHRVYVEKFAPPYSEKRGERVGWEGVSRGWEGGVREGVRG